MTELLAGVDLGGTAVKVALADLDGNLLIEDAIPTDSHRGPEDVIDRIGDLLVRLAERRQAGISAVGIGVPGLVDVQTGITRFLPNLATQWKNVPVADRLSARLGCPVRLLNDVRTATLAELKFGHGRNDPRISLAFFSLGTGVGGGIAIDGELRLGPLGAAGELGHQTVLPSGPRCGCGNKGCLEALASGPAIAAEGVRLMRMGLAPKLHELTGGNADRVTTREMAAASVDDVSVREAIIDAATWLGIAAANVVTTVHPQLIVLGGGVSEIGDLLTDTVRDVIAARVRMIPTDDIRVERSLMGEKAGVMGAVALAAREVLPDRQTR